MDSTDNPMVLSGIASDVLVVGIASDWFVAGKASDGLVACIVAGISVVNPKREP